LPRSKSPEPGVHPDFLPIGFEYPRAFSLLRSDLLAPQLPTSVRYSPSPKSFLGLPLQGSQPWSPKNLGGQVSGRDDTPHGCMERMQGHGGTADLKKYFSEQKQAPCCLVHAAAGGALTALPCSLLLEPCTRCIVHAAAAGALTALPCSRRCCWSLVRAALFTPGFC